jgi:hypothetical protein
MKTEKHNVDMLGPEPLIDPFMKTKVLIWSGLCIQCVFLIFLLFRAPEISGALKITRNELQNGDADLPALKLFNPDGSESTVIHDPAKSPSENLTARAVARLSGVDRGYGSLVRVALLVTLVNLILFIFSLRLLRPKSS